MVLGERLNDGAILYVDVWDNIGPFSAIIFNAVDFTFGRSLISIQIIGLLVFFFQTFYINFMALKHKMFNENNYLPALFYAILGMVFFNTTSLTPPLMGLTFVLLSIDNLLTHVESRNKTDGNLLNIGLHVGVAALFYLPFILFLFLHIATLLFFTNTLKRRYLLMLYGLFIPIAIVWLYYVWTGNASNFYNNYLYDLFRRNKLAIMDNKSVLIYAGTTILIFSISVLKILSGFGFNIFQVRIQKVMFFSSLMALFIWFFFSDKGGYGFIIFLPWVSVFLSHFFISFKNRLKRELGFFLYFATIILLYLGTAFHWFGLDEKVDFSELIVNSTEKQPIYSDKKVLIIGPDATPYLHCQQSTPYFNWELSRKQLEQLDFYDNIEAISKNIQSDTPQYIIDQQGIVPDLFDKLPILASEYTEVQNGIYKRIKVSS